MGWFLIWFFVVAPPLPDGPIVIVGPEGLKWSQSFLVEEWGSVRCFNVQGPLNPQSSLRGMQSAGSTVEALLQDLRGSFAPIRS